MQGSEQEDVVTTFLHGGIHSIIAVGSPRWVRGGCSAVRFRDKLTTCYSAIYPVAISSVLCSLRQRAFIIL